MINSYTITLRHDAGFHTVTVWARSLTRAVRLVLSQEHAPFRAVTSISKCSPGHAS